MYVCVIFGLPQFLRELNETRSCNNNYVDYRAGMTTCLAVTSNKTLHMVFFLFFFWQAGVSQQCFAGIYTLQSHCVYFLLAHTHTNICKFSVIQLLHISAVGAALALCTHAHCTKTLDNKLPHWWARSKT